MMPTSKEGLTTALLTVILSFGLGIWNTDSAHALLVDKTDEFCEMNKMEGGECFWWMRVVGTGSWGEGNDVINFPYEGRNAPLVMTLLMFPVYTALSAVSLAVSPLCLPYAMMMHVQKRFTISEELGSCFTYPKMHAKYALVMSPPAQMYYLGENVGARLKRG